MKTEKIKTILKYWLPIFLWAYFIFLMSSIPGRDVPVLFRYQDVPYHIAIFFIFAWLLKRALRYSFKDMSLLQQNYFTILIGLIYALSDEFHQIFVPQRMFSLMDVSMDGIGLFMATLIYPWRK